MLPSIHLGTLMTVTDNHVASRNREKKQAVMESRVTRSMEGFVIYQTYLRRLRRMHRAYITKYRKLHGRRSQPSPNWLQGPGGWNPNTMPQRQNNNPKQTPLNSITHRVSLAGAYRRVEEEDNGDEEQSEDFEDGNGNPIKDDVGQELIRNLENQLKAIHIPCGRENSFELGLETSPRLGATSNAFTRSNTKNSQHPHLSFRLWKQNEAPSIYSQPMKSLNVNNHNISNNKRHKDVLRKIPEPPKFMPKLFPKHEQKLRIKCDDIY